MTGVDKASVKAYHEEHLKKTMKEVVPYVHGIDPKLGSYLEAKFAGQNQREAAAACGVTDRTARTYEKKIRRLVLKFLYP